MGSPSHRLKSLRLSDARGVSGVAVEAMLEITAVVEGVHRSVHSTLGLPGGARAGRTGGITGLVYRSIEGVTRLTGTGLSAALALAENLGRSMLPASSGSRDPRRDVILGALNGVLGDRLWVTANPLAVPMEFRHGASVIGDAGPSPPAAAGRKILLLIHGLCLSDHCWDGPGSDAGSHHGKVLARRLGYTPVYLNYNSGRAIADNGRELAEGLERLLALWPVSVDELTILGHSMGGLLARSSGAAGGTSRPPLAVPAAQPAISRHTPSRRAP